MAGHWHTVMDADQLADGEMTCFELDGRRLLLARVDAQTFLAADEMCTHEDASLCLGALRGHRVKCPLHGSWFDLRDGAVQDEPAVEPLAVYPVAVRDGRVLIEL